MRAHYDFAKMKTRKNPYIKLLKQPVTIRLDREGTNLVLLAPDVAKAFPNADAVNEALRFVIQLRKVPGRGKKAATAKS